MLCYLAGGQKVVQSPLEERIDELKHHIRIETAIEEGAANAVKSLLMVKADEKALLVVSTNKHISINVLILEPLYFKILYSRTFIISETVNCIDKILGMNVKVSSLQP